MGRCSLLSVLKASSLSLNKLTLTFRTFIELDVICIEEAVCSQVVGKVIEVDDK